MQVLGRLEEVRERQKGGKEESEGETERGKRSMEGRREVREREKEGKGSMEGRRARKGKGKEERKEGGKETVAEVKEGEQGKKRKEI